MKKATVGNGIKVHYVLGVGTLCGAGGSSLAHSFRNLRPKFTNEPVTCKRCLEIARDRGLVVSTDRQGDK